MTTSMLATMRSRLTWVALAMAQGATGKLGSQAAR